MLGPLDSHVAWYFKTEYSTVGEADSYISIILKLWALYSGNIYSQLCSLKTLRDTKLSTACDLPLMDIIPTYSYKIANSPMINQSRVNGTVQAASQTEIADCIILIICSTYHFKSIPLLPKAKKRLRIVKVMIIIRDRSLFMGGRGPEILGRGPLIFGKSLRGGALIFGGLEKQNLRP